MSDEGAKPTEVNQAARDLIAAVRFLVTQATTSVLQMQTRESEAEASRYARAILDEMLTRQFPALTAAHDALAAELNAASPSAPPILSLTTELPA